MWSARTVSHSTTRTLGDWRRRTSGSGAGVPGPDPQPAIPSASNYRVDVWYPADPGYNSSAPYIVATSSGNQTVYVDQRSGGGAWRTIGTFSLSAGTKNVVGVSRWTSGTGYVIADAVRISRV